MKIKNRDLIRINTDTKEFLKKVSAEIISPIEGRLVPIAELNRRTIELTRKNPSVMEMLKKDAELRRKISRG